MSIAHPEWSLAFGTILSPQHYGGSSGTRRSATGRLKLIEGPPQGLDRSQTTPVAPHLEQIMRQADETPFTTDVCQPAEQEATEPTRFLDLTKHGFDDALAPRVQRLPLWTPYFCRHALLCRGGRLRGLHRRDMMPFAPRR